MNISYLRTAIVICVLVVSLAITNAQDDVITNDPIHTVIDIKGDVKVRKAGWTGFSNLSLGTTLQRGDLINPGDGSVTILCADLSEQIVSQLDGVPCTIERPVLFQSGSLLFSGQRGPLENIDSPFLISPRSTIILTAQPMIRWNPVIGVDGYEVSITSDDMQWSTIIDTDTVSEFQYPEDAPPLLTDVNYTVEIVALENGTAQSSSSDEDAKDISFTVMPKDDITGIETTVEILNTATDEDVVLLIEARYYAQNGLYAQALETLLPITGDVLAVGCISEETRLTQSPIVYMLLGEIYSKLGIEQYSVRAHLCALEVAESVNDLASRASAAAEIARALPAPHQDNYLTIALESWTELGAGNEIEDLQDAINGD